MRLFSRQVLMNKFFYKFQILSNTYNVFFSLNRLFFLTPIKWFLITK
jgi:hypothetical protein